MLKCECEKLVKNAREVDGCHTKNVFTGYINGMDAVLYTNTSSIVTKLIQEVGRLVDSYASDFIYTWNSIDNLIHSSDWLLGSIKRNESNYFPIGLKASGVDGGTNILANILDYNQYYYRKIFLLKIDVTGKPNEILNSFDGEIEIQLLEVNL